MRIAGRTRRIVDLTQRLLGDSRRLWRESLEIQADFIGLELELAKTFCDSAWAAGEGDKALRNFEHARRAWDAASKFAEQIKMQGGTLPARVIEQFGDIESLMAKLARRLDVDFV